MSSLSLAKALFEPQSIVLIGASSDLSKPSGRPLKYLLKHGYKGKLFPINPTAKIISGLQCFESAKNIPQAVDHAFIMLPRELVTDALLSCADLGIKCATILADGYSEAGCEGQSYQAALSKTAQDLNIRLLGPNSIGIINPQAGVALSANAMLELPGFTQGRTGVISQSGSLIGAILSHGEARHIGYSKLISVGNEADLSVGEIGNLLVEDKHTDVILLFLETIRDHHSIAEFARKAHKAGKPVVAYRVGRSEEGQKLARSHTGALASTDHVLSTFLEHHGVAQVTMFDCLIEAPRLFVQKTPTNTAHNTVAVVTTTGGGGAMLVDNLAMHGITIAKPAPIISKTLSEAGVKNESPTMIDLTMAGAKPELVQSIIENLMEDPSIDAIAMVIGSSARFYPEVAVAPLTNLQKRTKPLISYLVPDAQASFERLAKAGISVFRSPEACADGINNLLRWRAPSRSHQQTEISEFKFDANHYPNANLGELESLNMFSALGLSIAKSEVAKHADEAAAIAERIGFPVALKIVSPDLDHKTDVGGVELDISNAKHVKSIFKKMIANPLVNENGAEVKGVLVQEIRKGIAEVLIGYKRDPVVGPIVVLGPGGITAELSKKSSCRIAPVTPKEAEEMINELSDLAAIRGYRGLPRGDLDALSLAIAKMSKMAHHPDIIEAEANPVIVGKDGAGVVAVDGLVTIKKITSSSITVPEQPMSQP